MAFTQGNPWTAKFGSDISLALWTALSGSEQGTPALGPGWTDRSVQVDGTLGGATVVIQGSNDGSNWFTLHDPFGNELSFTAAGLAQITEAVAFMRPSISGGTGSSINVRILMVRHEN